MSNKQGGYVSPILTFRLVGLLALAVGSARCIRADSKQTLCGDAAGGAVVPGYASTPLIS
jgi:hypothetical protein